MAVYLSHADGQRDEPERQEGWSFKPNQFLEDLHDIKLSPEDNLILINYQILTRTCGVGMFLTTEQMLVIYLDKEDKKKYFGQSVDSKGCYGKKIQQNNQKQMEGIKNV